MLAKSAKAVRSVPAGAAALGSSKRRAGHVPISTVKARRRTVQQRGRLMAATSAAMLAPVAFMFTPLESSLGGLTLGLLAFAKLNMTGRILGISGTVRGIVRGSTDAWRIAFAFGLLAGGLFLRAVLPGAFEAIPAAYTLQRAALAGVLVGIGTSRGSGCTSGHGICGNARLSPRSFAATCTFMAAAMVASRLGNSAAIFSLPQGIAPLAWGSMSGTATFGAGLLAFTLATYLLLSVVARRLTAPSRAPSTAAKEAELKQAAALEEAPLTGTPPPATPDAQKLAALSTAADLFFGFLFALGLGVSGMTKPSKVTAFLSVLSGTFDPSLMFVMGGALLVALPTFQLMLRRSQQPLCAACFDLPTKRTLDANLLLGALTFGIGWGLGGICPGPGLVSLASGDPRIAMFVATMILGMRLDQSLEIVGQKQVA